MALEQESAAAAQQAGHLHAFGVTLNRLHVGIDRQWVAYQVNPFLAHGDQGQAQDAHQHPEV
jgi:hypothetical protein